MRVILLIICLSLLNGCLSTSANRDAAVQPLELFFSPEQTTLTAKQQQALQQFFTTYSYHQLEVSIGPADLSDRFQALLQGQKELQLSSNYLSKSKFHCILLLRHNKLPIRSLLGNGNAPTDSSQALCLLLCIMDVPLYGACSYDHLADSITRWQLI